MTMQPWPHQLEMAKIAMPVLLVYNLVYLAMEERTGKSITSLLMAEEHPTAKSVLIITKKKPMDGWNKTLTGCKSWLTKKYDVINYHGAKNIKKRYDLIILDEPHNYIAAVPNRSEMWKTIFLLCFGLPIIYCSATPHAQGYHMLFNQFAMSKWSPWKDFRNYYDWFKEYAKRDEAGNLPTTRISASQIVLNYKAIDEARVIEDTKHLFITKTRAEIGFEHEPEDVLHYITLDDKIKAIYNTIMTDKALSFTLQSTGRDYNLICDSPIKLRWACHMLEGGTLKIGNEYIDLGNHEKVDYILKTWGDTKDLAIMYQYKADKIKLEKYFKNALVLQGVSYAEGVDLSGYKNLVIYSQDFSTAKHTQRRARQANLERKEEIKVHFLLVKRAVSEQVYKTCSVNKRDFVDSLFERNML